MKREKENEKSTLIIDYGGLITHYA